MLRPAFLHLRARGLKSGRQVLRPLRGVSRMSAMPPGVEHDARNQRFKYGGTLLEYNVAEGVAEMYHTFTPESERGQGRAKTVTIAALDWARGEGLRVNPTCSYVAAVMKKEKDAYGDLAVDE